MDQQLSFVMKEEILRNVIKTHSIVMVVGWPGYGKTVTTLKACKGMGDVYYCGGAGTSVSLHNDSATVVRDIHELKEVRSDQPLLIVDELEGADDKIMELLSANPANGKIVVIAKTMIMMKDILPLVDAVVRFKNETVDVLHTRFQDITDTASESV